MQCPKLICQPKAVNEIKKSPRFGIREIWTSSPWCLGKYPCLQYATLIVFASIIIKLTVDLKANGGKSMLTYYTLIIYRGGLRAPCMTKLKGTRWYTVILVLSIEARS